MDDARPNLVTLAEQLPDSAYSFLERPVPEIKTVPRQRPQRHKPRIVQERGFETIHTLEEMVAVAKREISANIEHQESATKDLCFLVSILSGSRKSRLLLCLLPQKHSACIDRLPRFDPAPRFDGWMIAIVLVRPRPLSFTNALCNSAM